MQIKISVVKDAIVLFDTFTLQILSSNFVLQTLYKDHYQPNLFTETK